MEIEMRDSEVVVIKIVLFVELANYHASQSVSQFRTGRDIQ